MSRDITEQIDDICRAEYGHTNWAFTDTLSEKELEEIKSKNTGIKLPSIVFYYDDFIFYITQSINFSVRIHIIFF